MKKIILKLPYSVLKEIFGSHISEEDMLNMQQQLLKQKKVYVEIEVKKDTKPTVSKESKLLIHAKITQMSHYDELSPQVQQKLALLGIHTMYNLLQYKREVIIGMQLQLVTGSFDTISEQFTKSEQKELDDLLVQYGYTWGQYLLSSNSEEFLRKSVSILGLTKSQTDRLKKIDILTVLDLKTSKKSELLKFSGIGPVFVSYLTSILASKGLSFEAER